LIPSPQINNRILKPEKLAMTEMHILDPHGDILDFAP